MLKKFCPDNLNYERRTKVSTTEKSLTAEASCADVFFEGDAGFGQPGRGCDFSGNEAGERVNLSGTHG
jgi:hypothetical protein